MPDDELWACSSRIEYGMKLNLFFFYQILILWFIPLLLLLFTYVSVSVTLIRSIRQTSLLVKAKRFVSSLIFCNIFPNLFQISN